jgi:hypothetical protein
MTALILLIVVVGTITASLLGVFVRICWNINRHGIWRQGRRRPALAYVSRRDDNRAAVA